MVKGTLEKATALMLQKQLGRKSLAESQTCPGRVLGGQNRGEPPPPPQGPTRIKRGAEEKVPKSNQAFLQLF